MRNAIIAGVSGLIVGAALGVFVLAPRFGPPSAIDSAVGTDAGGRSFTGMQVQGLTAGAAKALGLEKPFGVLVRDVDLGGPANMAGVRRGDLIVEFNGEKIDTFQKLMLSAGRIKAGDATTVVVRRRSKDVSLTLIAGSWPPSRTIETSTLIHIPTIGLSFASITKKVREGFGLRWSSEGVVVTKIEDGKLEGTGLKPGEIIVQVNQRAVWNPQQLADEIQKAKAGGHKAVLLLIEGSEPGRNGFRYSLMPIE